MLALSMIRDLPPASTVVVGKIGRRQSSGSLGAGQFDDGWDAYRERVFARQKELGVMPADAELSRHDPDVPEWESLGPDARRLAVRLMEVYAGFLSHAGAANGGRSAVSDGGQLAVSHTAEEAAIWRGTELPEVIAQKPCQHRMGWHYSAANDQQVQLIEARLDGTSPGDAVGAVITSSVSSAGAGGGGRLCHC